MTLPKEPEDKTSSHPHQGDPHPHAHASTIELPHNPKATEAINNPHPTAAHRDATRYGDWELKGRCIDF